MIPQFDISFYPTQIFWLVITFCLLYLLNAKLLIPLLSGKMKGRNDLIDKLANDTSEIILKCKEKEAEIQKLKRDAVENSQHIKLEANDKTQKAISDEVHRLNENFSKFLNTYEKTHEEKLLKLETELPKIIKEIKSEYFNLLLKSG